MIRAVQTLDPSGYLAGWYLGNPIPLTTELRQWCVNGSLLDLQQGGENFDDVLSPLPVKATP